MREESEMNCVVHPDKVSARKCSGCGKPFCEECLSRSVDGSMCDACAGAKAKGGVPVWVWVLMAVGGFCLIACPVVAVIVAIAVPNIIGERKMGNETAAIGALRTVASVQAHFRGEDREGDGFLDYATSLEELSQVGLIDNVLGRGVKSGYVFSLSGSTYEWSCSATPVSASTASRSFIVCVDGVVRFAPAGPPADCSSPAIE